MGQSRDRGRDRAEARMTGADGVSVLPAAMAAALVAAGIAITWSVRRSRATVRQLATKAAEQPGAAAGTGRRAAGSGATGPSGQVAVRATVDDDGR
ncbi:hypothetical protein [Micrococcus sp. TA1]|uniref:hypothetical protein n=1 Tax=Micrococcus sp. TA1 TaxID=681627 RepID=UPI00160D9D4B|nr:hypothetical protein [Micrococcus sp. TA1]MBB5750722.1 hypothetical protein [Micrococcus sp. TA1]